MYHYGQTHHWCGCSTISSNGARIYLPQVDLESHTTILATTSSTKLKQTFSNPGTQTLKEVKYTFPLYDGVSVGSFKCTVGENVIVGIVKERNQARADYNTALAKGQTAGLFEQNIDAADVFTTSVGNVPPNQNVVVEITYLGELKNDAETNGARFTIPTQIAPRYGSQTLTHSTAPSASASGGIKITVDVELEQGVSLRGIQSPSHPIAVTMGRTSTMMEDDDTFESNLGSSALALGSTELDKDFVIVVQAKGQDIPRAILENHPTIPNQRALMATLVPKFNIPNEHPEIVFVVDRSGSMGGKMRLVVDALKVFLKSLPVSVKFNICSFGSHHDFLFDRSKTYDENSLKTAMDHVQRFEANYGGTEMLGAVKDVLKQRYNDLSLEVMLLTDGEIWNQDALFTEINNAKNARFFTLGIGSAASSSLVEGIARAGRGFAQWVNDGERIDKRIVRMLKAALTPHIQYQLEAKYSSEFTDTDDFEIVESFEKSMNIVLNDDAGSTSSKSTGLKKKVISLFDSSTKDEPTNPVAGRYDHLPKIAVPNVLQTPHDIPELYPHSRTTVYLLLGPDSATGTLKSIVLRGQSKHGELRLEIPVQDIGAGTTIHQLAAKKAMQELEEGRGWLTCIRSPNGKIMKSQYESQWDLIVEHEAVRLGTTFQVGGKHCSFVAVDETATQEQASHASELQDYQMGLMVLEQQNKSRKRMASHNIIPGSSQGGRGGIFGSSMTTRSIPQAHSSGFGSAMPAMQAQQANTMVGLHSPVMAAALAPPDIALDDVILEQYAKGMEEAASRALPDEDDPDLGTDNSQAYAPPIQHFASMAYAPPAYASAAPPPPPAPSVRSAASFLQSAAPYGNSAIQPCSVSRDASQVSHFFHFAWYSDANVSLQTVSMNTLDSAELGGECFNLDFSTLDNADVLENFDFDSFLASESDFGLDGFAINQYQTQVDPIANSRAQAPDITVDPTTRSRRIMSFGRAEAPEKNGESKPVSVRTQIDKLTPLEKMQRLLTAQTFSGSWMATEEVLAVISHGSQTSLETEHKVVVAVRPQHESLVPDNIAGIGGDSTMYTTVLCIAWLEKVMKDEEDVWEMVVEKAKSYLEGQVGIEVAGKLVQACKTMY